MFLLWAAHVESRCWLRQYICNTITLQWRHNEQDDVPIVYSTVCSGTDQMKHQRSVPLAFVWGIQRWPVNISRKGPVTRKMFPFEDVIMKYLIWFNNKTLGLDYLTNTLTVPLLLSPEIVKIGRGRVLRETYPYAIKFDRYVNSTFYGQILISTNLYQTKDKKTKHFMTKCILGKWKWYLLHNHWIRVK